jgi:hypothetical protein
VNRIYALYSGAKGFTHRNFAFSPMQILPQRARKNAEGVERNKNSIKTQRPPWSSSAHSALNSFLLSALGEARDMLREAQGGGRLSPMARR